MTKPTKSNKTEKAASPTRSAKAKTPASVKKAPAAKKPKAPAPSPLEIAAALNADRDAIPEAAAAPVASAPTTPAPAEAHPVEAHVQVAPLAPAAPAVDACEPEALAPALPFLDRVRAREGTAEVLVFRVGDELFAAALTAIEEALELPNLSHLPEMPPSMLGVISLRGRMLPAYSPARPLGVALARADAAALVLRAGDRRVALAVDDVDDVLTVDLAELRPPPVVAGEERDAVLLGVARRGGDLVAVLDADALVTACLSDQQALEIA